MHRIPVLTACVLLLGLGAPERAGASAHGAAHAQARSLLHQALARLSENSIDSRRVAVQALEDANRLAPEDAEIELALARADFLCGFVQSARRHLEHVVRTEPASAAGHLDLGRAWKRAWLRSLDKGSLQHAVEELVRATVLDTSNADAWLELEPLLVMEDNVGAAFVTAFRAAKADPERPEALLAVASACWRVGLAHDADSLFRATIPRLRRAVRERFEDVAPLVSAEEAETLRQLPEEEHAAFADRYWKSRDPDPRTPENEARLEFWSRATQAYLLFFDPRRDTWDARGNIYVRYGPPAEMRYDPLTEPHSSTFAIGSDFPTHVQVWSYPALGITVRLDDLTLDDRYTLPIDRAQAMDPADPMIGVGTR